MRVYKMTNKLSRIARYLKVEGAYCTIYDFDWRVLGTRTRIEAARILQIWRLMAQDPDVYTLEREV